MPLNKHAVIIGAGPAGLTAAYELLKNSDYKVTILEETDRIGGISCTVNYNGNRMDIGGHRFYSKSDRVMDWWTSFLPVQGAPAKDDLLLNRNKPLNPKGPDPEKADRVMLHRNRISRIYYMRKFFNYPISLKTQTFLNMGLLNTVRAGVSYVYSSISKRTERSLEDFIINRFGRALYRMFFENYTEKVWGIHPSKISADWGAQRIKGLSLSKVLWDLATKPLKNKGDLKQKNVETSLIDQFLYPKYGPGQLWEAVAKEFQNMGGTILKNCRVSRFNASSNSIQSLCYENNRETHTLEGDMFLSSMPVRDLVTSLYGVSTPHDIVHAAKNLPYRDFITVGVLTNRLNLRTKTKIKTVGDIIPDCWIYIQESDVKVGRLQIFNNWSPYMVQDIENTVWVGMEYFCNEGDSLWEMEDDAFISFAVEELQKIGIINKNEVLNSTRVKIKKAYPAYFGSYEQFGLIQQYLDGFDNLYCIGRNGQHRYNNMDHSMLTAMEAVDNILEGRWEKSNVWSVNTEEMYQEVR
jgi:protoporphyrinogen oxidase